MKNLLKTLLLQTSCLAALFSTQAHAATRIMPTYNASGDFVLRNEDGQKFIVYRNPGSYICRGLDTNGSTILFSISATGGVTFVGMTLSGDLAVNGGDITSTATTFNFDIGNTGTFLLRDGTNTLFSVADAGTTGNATVTGTLAVTGNVAVATNKFTVAAASGNTLVAGTLAVTGNSTLTGTLAVTGAVTTARGKFPLVQKTGQCAAKSAVAIMAATALTASPQPGFTTGLSNPDVYRCVTATGNAGGIVGNVVVNGTDWGDNPITDTIALNGATEVLGVKPFKTVVSVDLPAETNVGTDTVSLGYSDILGLYRPLAATGDVKEVARKASAATEYTIEATGTVSAVNGTVDQTGTAVITVNDRFEISYNASGL